METTSREGDLRHALVDQLKSRGAIQTASVEAAFRAVPRHVFLPAIDIERVYADVPIPVKRERGITLSGSSQPTIMAVMFEMLDLQPGHRILEIGAGTGYNAALMSEIVGEGGDVITVDVDDDITAMAAERLRAAGYERVRVVCADGGHGFSDRAPYDRIVLTVGAWDVAPAWVDQLAPDGVLLLPLWLRGLEVLASLRRDSDCLRSESIRRCSFMRLRGDFHGPEGSVVMDESTELSLEVEDRSSVDAAAVLVRLRGPHRDHSSGVLAKGEELSSLGVWTALSHSAYCGVSIRTEAESPPAIPWHFRTGPFRRTFGLSNRSGICLVSRGPGDARDGTPMREVRVRAFGDGDQLAEELVAQIRAWDEEGRPEPEQYRLRVYPRAGAVVPALMTNERWIEKQWTRLAVSWPVRCADSETSST